MRPAEQIVVGIVLLCVAVAVFLLAIEAQSARAVSPSTIAVHRDALSEHARELQELRRASDRHEAALRRHWRSLDGAVMP